MDTEDMNKLEPNKMYVVMDIPTTVVLVGLAAVGCVLTGWNLSKVFPKKNRKSSAQAE